MFVSLRFLLFDEGAQASLCFREPINEAFTATPVANFISPLEL